MRWINFLHFYQPANLESPKIKQALDQSYWRLLRLMEENERLSLTANFSGCLLKRLQEEGELDFLRRLKRLVSSGRLELVGSAAYHGFLPGLPIEESSRQIKEQEKIIRDIFGPSLKLSGFFLPEMAYSRPLGELIKSLGYDWIILDEIAYSPDLSRRPDADLAYFDAASSLRVIFRNRRLSRAYPPDKLGPLCRQAGAAGKTFITATDAELYGLRHQDPTAELEKLARCPRVKTMTISRFLAGLKGSEKIHLTDCSWESRPAELQSKRPYVLWQDRSNRIHKNLWRLSFLALEAGDKFPKDKNFAWYRWHLVRGLASCTFWWASGRDFSSDFGPYAWSPDDIERGLEDLVRSVRSLSDSRSRQFKLAAEKHYIKIKKLIWEEHWHRHWRQRA